MKDRNNPLTRTTRCITIINRLVFVIGMYASRRGRTGYCLAVINNEERLMTLKSRLRVCYKALREISVEAIK